ncbi:(4Fe-4S)-binding protein [Solibacillus sp. CAU 1738]|uniref:(4Fe-4S)-binding protein n=1 Tax=Solibacillus sp. CAU 1738 TaxID=3140363 RepID=UPI0032619306
MTEQQLIEQGYRKYEGEGIDVYYALNLCKHAGKCVKGSAEAFDPKRKPWILPNAETSVEMARIIDTCPTKALQYIVKEQK